MITTVRLRRLLPPSLRTRARAMERQITWLRTPRVACDTTPLAREFGPNELRAILTDPAIDQEWVEIGHELAALGVGELSGGVNPGDQRAIYYLIRGLQVRSVLEIGTHIGASTIHFACALREAARRSPDRAGELVTVDIIDVNDPVARPWERVGSPKAPEELVGALQAESYVRFVHQPALQYLASTDRRFDFCFLDGDHTAATVYRELPAALAHLATGGVVLLHDYFPNGERLWPEGELFLGPWRATERLRREGARLRVLPLGALPWPTKLGSNLTSLALVVSA